MSSYLTLAIQALNSMPRSSTSESNEKYEISAQAVPSAEPSFVNSVSFVGSEPLAELTDDPAFHAWDGQSFDGISDRLLVALRARAATGDAQAAKEAIELADYLAACDRGEVRCPAHPTDEELARWNRNCAVRRTK